MSDQKNVFFYHFIYYKMFSQNMRLGKKKKNCIWYGKNRSSDRHVRGRVVILRAQLP